MARLTPAQYDYNRDVKHRLRRTEGRATEHDNGSVILQNNVVTGSSAANASWIAIPPTATAIQTRAFYRSQTLDEVDLGFNGELFAVRPSAFEGCTRLRAIKLPNTLQRIEARAFASSGITRVELEIPSSLVVIESGAFADTPLRDFTIPSKVKSIGQAAFSNCPQLGSLDYEGRLSRFGAGLCAGCIALRQFNAPQGLLDLPRDAFSGCVELTQVDLHATALTRICNGAFYQCPQLTVVVVPGTVEILGEHAELAQPIPEQNTHGAFEDCTALSQIVFGTVSGFFENYAKVREIGQRCFKNCIMLNVNFECCTELREIGVQAFHSCAAIREADFSRSRLGRVQAEAFEDCWGLWRVAFPSSLVLIGDRSFRNCTNIGAIVFQRGRIEVGIEAFWPSLSVICLHVPVMKTRARAFPAEIEQEPL